MADVADTQSLGRKKHGGFDIGHLDKLHPFLWPHPFATAEGLLVTRAVPADMMKIQRRKQTVPAQLMILLPVGFLQVVEQSFILDHVPIRIDNFVIHRSSGDSATYLTSLLVSRHSQTEGRVLESAGIRTLSKSLGPGRRDHSSWSGRGSGRQATNPLPALRFYSGW